MNPLWGHAVGVLIVLMMTAFIGIWVWAWLPYHQRTFGWLARMPMEDRIALEDGSIPSAGGEQETDR
ncbi:MAG: hypothetical protein IT532_17050 [Burkholderiales bacterium]|nr:hypothetical protein [Burkholderiales bacterium]